MTVDSVAYLTRLVGYDTEECIQKAVEEGVIELDHKSKWERDHDVYRFTAKGRRVSDEYARGVFERSAERARKNHEEDLRVARNRAAAATTAVGGRPPPTHAE